MRISGISASAKVQECDAIFNVSLKNDNTIQGVGSNILIYQPWTVFSIPGLERNARPRPSQYFINQPTNQSHKRQ